MSIEEKKLLTDILICVSSINDHLEGRRNFDEYTRNKTQRRAVKRELKLLAKQ